MLLWRFVCDDALDGVMVVVKVLPFLSSQKSSSFWFVNIKDALVFRSLLSGQSRMRPIELLVCQLLTLEIIYRVGQSLGQFQVGTDVLQCYHLDFFFFFYRLLCCEPAFWEARQPNKMAISSHFAVLLAILSLHGANTQSCNLGLSSGGCKNSFWTLVSAKFDQSFNKNLYYTLKG